MPDVVDARTLAADAAARAGLDCTTLGRIFEGTPLDFPVLFSSSLPLFAHRLGMSGITLFGRVHLLARTQFLPPDEIIVLLRHEAEHIRQQREDGASFYPRYLYDWIGGFFRKLPGTIRARWRHAYLNIPYEQQAYAAGGRARAIINRK